MMNAKIGMAGRREWIGLIVLALPTLLLSMDISVLFLALPQLSEDLGASSTQQLWISDIYGFMLAGFLVTMGTLGDRIGRRRLLLTGAGAFGAASIVAAFSVSAPMLIASRALMGVAAATLTPSTLALIGNMFQHPKQRRFAVAVWSSCFFGGLALGPVLGGFLLDHFWWGSAFLIGVPVMLVLLAAGPRVLPEFRDPGAGKLDLLSVSIYLLAVLPAIYGLKEIARDGWHLPSIVALLVGVAFGIACLERQRRLSDPLFDLRLFADRSFSSVVSILTLVGVIQSGVLLLVNLYLQLVVGLSPLQAGLWLLPAALAMIGATLIAPRIAHRVRVAWVMAAGLAVSACGYVVVSLVDRSMGLTVLILGLTVINVGVGPMVALGYDVVLASAPPEKAGSASSVAETGGEFGVALGIAVFGSLGAAIYGLQMADALPAGISHQVAATAQESLAGAVSSAAQLGPPLGPEVLGAAHDAFTTAMDTVAMIGAALFVSLAILAAVALRQVRPRRDATPSHSGS
jgi:DHA2 family multidrug resistance protein-like MFS transporter